MELDDTDRAILYMLQRDARGITTREMAERVGMSASTVRNRIERMESEGVVRGYHPIVDYDNAGLQLHVFFICSAPNPDRERLATDAREVAGVVAVYEVLNGKDNIQVEAVGRDTDDMARINDELSDIGLEVINSKVIKSAHLQPYDHFGQSVVEDMEE
jgi:DNA-binding Lrp family transcriptional regulator